MSDPGEAKIIFVNISCEFVNIFNKYVELNTLFIVVIVSLYETIFKRIIIVVN